MRDGIIGVIMGMVVGAMICFAACKNVERARLKARLADMYLKSPPGQIQGMDANDLAVRQAWTSSVLRQSAIKVQQDVVALQAISELLTSRLVKLEDANDAD